MLSQQCAQRCDNFEILARSDLPAGRVDVAVVRGTETVTVTVRYRQATDVPLVGRLVGDAGDGVRRLVRGRLSSKAAKPTISGVSVPS